MGKKDQRGWTEAKSISETAYASNQKRGEGDAKFGSESKISFTKRKPRR